MPWSLDGLFTSGGLVEDYLEREGWVFFSQYSPYSPRNLGNLRQPRPSGTQSEIEPPFTFQDAFEDLLALSAGKPMMSLDSRRDAARVIRQVFPNGEPPGFWVRRLQAQGLLQTSARPRTSLLQPVKGCSPWLETEESRFSRLPGAIQGADAYGTVPRETPWSSVFEAVDQAMEASLPEPMSNIWRTWIGETMDGNLDTRKKKAKDWDSKAPDKSALRHATRGPDTTGTVSRGAVAEQPDSLENMAASHTAEAVRNASWGTFQALMDEVQKQVDHAERMAHVIRKTVQATEEVKAEEGSVISTVQEFVDEHGKLHVKTETRRLDRNGQQISRDTEHRTTGLPGHESLTVDAVRKAADEKAKPAATKTEKQLEGEHKRKGWFWSS